MPVEEVKRYLNALEIFGFKLKCWWAEITSGLVYLYVLLAAIGHSLLEHFRICLKMGSHDQLVSVSQNRLNYLANTGRDSGFLK